MGYTKDLWTRPDKQPDGKVKRVPNARWGKGKRWLACWLDPDGEERTKAFTNKTPADKYWRDQESARDRGEYVDPKAGQELMGSLAARYLGSLTTDPSTKQRYEEAWRLRIAPEFAKRKVRSMNRPSEMKEFFAKLSNSYGESTIHITKHVLGAMLELAVADGDLRKNPVRNKVVTTSKPTRGKITVWSDTQLWEMIDAHPAPLRALPIVGATCGHREGELFGFAIEDIDYDREVVHIRRQIKRVGKHYMFALPKNDTERIVPLSSFTAQVLRTHLATYPPLPITLPWESADGPRRTHKLVFVHPETGEHLRSITLARYWNPALEKAGFIGPRVKVPNGTRYVVDSRKHGRHQLRHYYANAQLSGGTNIRELADYLGHSDPGFTLRVYGHLQPDSHDRARKAIDDRFFRPRPVAKES